jgi:glutathione reductase (NADPH)
MIDNYDAIIIGSGTAGQTAAYDLKAHGLKVGIVEHSDRPGGTCALSGCQAKKWFYEASESVARSRHLCGLGIQTPALASWSALRNEKNKFTARVPANTRDGLEKAGIDYIPGRARFTNPNTISVDRQQLSARHIIIATGAVPMPLPIDGARSIITSNEFMELDQLPRRIIFIGGGFISFEFAHFAVRLGDSDTRCTILEAGQHPLGPFDQQMVGLLTQASEKEGIEVRCNVTITGIEKTGGRFTVKTEDGSGFASDLVVHGAGRAPAVDDLDLDQAGVEYSRRGITVNAKMATTNPHVYAVGDCAATIQLARVADAEAHVAAADILGDISGAGAEKAMDYTAVPSVLFTYPQYGMVGVTEDALKAEQVPYRKSYGDALNWPTYKRVGMRSAAYKLLADKDGRLLGAHVLSDNATGLIGIFTLGMVNRIAVEDLYQQCIMTPYPSRESDILYMLKPLLG